MLKALLKSIVGGFAPTIAMVPDTTAPTTSDHAPTITTVVGTTAPNVSVAAPVQPTNADHLQWRRLSKLDQCVNDRIAIERFNAWHARAGTGIRAEPVGKSLHTIDAPTAAMTFVRWAAERHHASELKVDDLWVLASEVFAPAHYLTLPPRRVFLGALQRVPGVMVVYDRRIYGRDGRVLAKTTFYTLPTGPAPSASALPALAEKSIGGTPVVREPVAANTMPTIEPVGRSYTALARARIPFALMI